MKLQVPTGPLENRFGIPTRLYKLDENAFDNGVRNADNLCYCKDGKCLPEGLTDFSECMYGKYDMYDKAET